MKPGANSKRIVVLLALMLILVLFGKAQSNLVFYHTKDQYNTSNLNPAYLSSQEKFTFSFFPLSGVSVGLNNQENIKDIINLIQGGHQPDEDLKSAFNNLINGGLFYQHIESTLLNIGYNSDFGAFSFRIKENAQLLGNFQGEFSEFLMSPKFQSIVIDQPQYFPVDAVHYREYSLGYAREIFKSKLSVGVRAKLYFGKSSLFSEVEGKVIREADNFYLQTSGPMRLTAPVADVLKNGLLVELNLADNFTVANYLMNSKNSGMGFDLGFKYKITPDLALSASILDVGRIKWKNNQNTLLFNSKYQFSSYSVTEAINKNGLPILSKKYDKTSLSDSITKLFNIEIDNLIYSKPLPVTLYAGLQYQINPTLNLGIVDRFKYAKGLNHNSFSMTANYDVNKTLSVSTGYSIIGNSYFNIPFAILYQWASGQTYIGTDNVLSYFFPSFSDFTGITFGMCLFPFRTSKKYTNDWGYLPFYKQKKRKSLSKKGLIYNSYSGS